MDANTIRTANGHEWTRIIRQKKLQMDQAAGKLQIYAGRSASQARQRSTGGDPYSCPFAVLFAPLRVCVRILGCGKCAVA
jgi:hypothetical protein